jgi:hypothetical protein
VYHSKAPNDQVQRARATALADPNLHRCARSAATASWAAHSSNLTPQLRELLGACFAIHEQYGHATTVFPDRFAVVRQDHSHHARPIELIDPPCELLHDLLGPLRRCPGPLSHSRYVEQQKPEFRIACEPTSSVIESFLVVFREAVIVERELLQLHHW